MLFQGEEWSSSSPFRYFTDHQDRELGQAVTEGRTNEFSHFGWDPADVPDPQDPATYEASKLVWDEVAEPGHAELLEWHRDLITLRRRHRSLHDGRWADPQTDHDPDAGWTPIRRGDLTVAPDPQDPATYEASKLVWDEVAEPGHAELLEWHRDLITLRRRHRSLTDGRWADQQIDHDPDVGWIRIWRGDVIVVLNLGSVPCSVPVPDGAEIAEVDGRELASMAARNEDVVGLDPDGVAVLVITPS